jgi:HAD superfamily hydrolase (TIGR01450 family)
VEYDEQPGHPRSLASAGLCQHVAMTTEPAPEPSRPGDQPQTEPRGDPKKGTWVVDLDGVVWLTGHPIKGSAEAIGRLRSSGIRVLFVTNNAAPTLAALLERLDAAGIETESEDVVSSAQAAASMLDPGSRGFVCGDDGVREALGDRGIEVVTAGPAEAVIVGWTKTFDFGILETSMGVVRSGARLIGTNSDPTHPGPAGLSPGAGSILAAVATASERLPEMAGKPEAPMAALVGALAPDVSMVVGDRPSTDGLFACRLGVRYGLVLSGVTPPGHGPLEQTPDLEAPDLAGIVDLVLGVP